MVADHQGRRHPGRVTIPPRSGAQVQEVPLLMSAFGTKRTCRERVPMSAFGGKADMTQTSENVCF